jgi:peroxiredoxin
MQHQPDIDWSTLPKPEDDGACNHLTGHALPAIALPVTTGGEVDLSALSGTTVLYIYPMTAHPDHPAPGGWDMLPGARGCTPQSCAFRDHVLDLRQAGADHLYGLSTQDTAYQQEAAERLHLPFGLLSDKALAFAAALNLPTFEVEGKTLIRRITLIIQDGRIVQVFYPVFPPDRNAVDVLDWLHQHPVT